MNNQIAPHEFTSKSKSVQHFYSKIATGEIITFVLLMIFVINVELALDRANKIFLIWMWIFIFLGLSMFVYLLTWYYLRVDLNGLTILFRFQYKRIEWAEITHITAKMRHSKQKGSNIFHGIGVVTFYPYLTLTGALQLSIYTSKSCIKTPNQVLRFNAINRFVHYIINLQKYSIQRFDSEAKERGYLFYYINWEIELLNSLSKKLSLNDQFNLILRNNSEQELNQQLSWIYKLAISLSFLGLIDLLFVMYIFLLGEFDLSFILIVLFIGIGIFLISILLSVLSPEVRKIEQYQPYLKLKSKL
ncbi:MAG: hypothetical protein ACFE9R_09365 [Candidatus Hermodarchaeota archaeon]